MTGGRATVSKQRIVVGVDGSEPSKAALLWAARLAPALNAEIEAVITWQFPANYGWTVGVGGAWSPNIGAGAVLEETLDEVFGSDRPVGLTTSVREGSASYELLAASSDADLLVVGSRGHGGFAGLLLGSVSTTCAEHATCPVLVVHGEPVETSAALQRLLTAAHLAGCQESTARMAVHGILVGFLSHLPQSDRRALTGSLPADVLRLTHSSRISKISAGLLHNDLDSLVDLCATAGGCTREEAHEVVVSVLQTLRELLPEPTRNLQAHLPNELADLWTASPVASQPTATSV